MMSKLTRLISIIYKVFVLKYELFRKLQKFAKRTIKYFAGVFILYFMLYHLYVSIKDKPKTIKGAGRLTSCYHSQGQTTITKITKIGTGMYIISIYIHYLYR